MHIYIPLEPVYTYEDSRNFAELLARLVIAERPGLFTTPRSVAQHASQSITNRFLPSSQSRTRSLRAVFTPLRCGWLGAMPL